MTTHRLDYAASCRRLQPKYLDEGAVPPQPIRRPAYDDEDPLGISFFRTLVGEGDDLSNLTLPRTFFGKSEVSKVSFRNTDFSESTLCWNDFIEVDFSGASLPHSDLRAALFDRCDFSGTDLRGADLRISTFADCVFEGARMDRAILTRQQGASLPLSDDQRSTIAWTDDDGPAPGGG